MRFIQIGLLAIFGLFFYSAFGLTISFGTEPIGYHLHSLVWQILASYLAYRLFLIWGLPNAHIAAALFLLHPLQTETTYRIVARNDTMAMSFSFLVLILWSKPASVQRDILGGLCILLALGSKETAFVFWPLLLVLVWFKRIGLSRLRILLSIAVTVGFLAYRAFVLPSNVFPPIERWHFLFGHTQDWLTYMLGKLILPVPLASHMPIGWLQIHWHLVLGTGVLLVLFLIAMLRFSRLVLLLQYALIFFIGTAVIGSAWLDRGSISWVGAFRNLFMACRLASVSPSVAFHFDFAYGLFVDPKRGGLAIRFAHLAGCASRPSIQFH